MTQEGVVPYREYVPFCTNMCFAFRARNLAKRRADEMMKKVEEQTAVYFKAQNFDVVCKDFLDAFKAADNDLQGVLRVKDFGRCMQNVAMKHPLVPREILEIRERVARDAFGEITQLNHSLTHPVTHSLTHLIVGLTYWLTFKPSISCLYCIIHSPTVYDCHSYLGMVMMTVHTGRCNYFSFRNVFIEARLKTLKREILLASYTKLQKQILAACHVGEKSHYVPNTLRFLAGKEEYIITGLMPFRDLTVTLVRISDLQLSNLQANILISAMDITMSENVDYYEFIPFLGNNKLLRQVIKPFIYYLTFSFHSFVNFLSSVSTGDGGVAG